MRSNFKIQIDVEKEGKNMKNKIKVIIVYHSGSGSTKTIAEIYHKQLLQGYQVDMSPINLEYDYKRLNAYDFIIFAFPTYHCAPSTSMMDFIHSMPVFENNKKSFAFTTCGLYSGNALRRFIKACEPKNIEVGGSAVYRGPASDGALLLPPVSLMFHYQKNIIHKIKSDINQIAQLILADSHKTNYPRFKLHAILNYPNEMIGKLYKHKIKVLEAYCIHCNKCINNCIRHCWVKGDKIPKYEKDNCEFCFRCVHHCPKGAIVLSKSTQNKPKLDEKFYNNLKEKLKRN